MTQEQAAEYAQKIGEMMSRMRGHAIDVRVAQDGDMGWCVELHGQMAGVDGGTQVLHSVAEADAYIASALSGG